MLHLLPLPGSPLYENLNKVIEMALKDLKSLQEGGVDGILIENFNDVPFYKDDVPKETVASMTRVCTEVMKNTYLPTGINVLRNDSIASLAIAQSCNCKFIRANIITDAYVTDQGIIEGISMLTIFLFGQMFTASMLLLCRAEGLICLFRML